MAFHLLGSWKVTSAYRVVADLLGSDSEKVEWLLGDAVTTTSHRVMFNLFDGDMAPIKGLIENPERGRLCPAPDVRPAGHAHARGEA